MAGLTDLWMAYRMRWKRRRFLFRAIRSRHQLSIRRNRTTQIKSTDVIAFACVRDEILRLPYFLQHHRKLGVRHFLFVDNGSSDGTTEFLEKQPDVSLWTTDESYKASRFGMDWLNWLLFRYGAGHWTVTLDADELLIFPRWEKGLSPLIEHLETKKIKSFGALMIDLFPKGRLGRAHYASGQNPLEVAPWFCPEPLRHTRQSPMKNLWVQGGLRDLAFFRKTPSRAPTLNKIPLVKWSRRYVYMNSTHAMLPPMLNAAYIDFDDNWVCSGALLHTKFMSDVVERARNEKVRDEHFSDGAAFSEYYDAIAADPDLWTKSAVKFENWEQLERLGLLSRGDWS